MKLEKVNQKNKETAIKMQREIFPLEDGSKSIIDSVNGTPASHLFMLDYWLVKQNEKYIGICGLYAYKAYKQDAWLGWFGITKSERRKGFGSKVLSLMMEQAKAKGFENLRLYTDEVDNQDAVKLYEKFGMTKEIYKNADDVFFEMSDTLIFSKNLNGENARLWNNKFLNIAYYEIKAED